MIRIILTLFIFITLTSCASIQEKMPERQACTGDETNKTLTEVFCKKQ
ncbi:hypothetical protein N9J29_01665 [Candidatus Pelagibacter sp.]|nr:hypothetical protein [Candidatus Pelagibacter sp.]MDA9136809.1 hypothetical protein [Candidatus Pelagibacter sp.]